MTRPAYSHDEWTELVCGLALDALEPEDETEVLEHLAECVPCQELHAELVATAGELAALAEGVDAPDEVLQVLRAEIARTPRLLTATPEPRRSGDGVPPVIVMPAPRAPARHRGRALVGSMAVFVLLAGIGSYAVDLRAERQHSQQVAVASRLDAANNQAVAAGFAAAAVDPIAVTWKLAAADASATVVESRGHGYLSASNLPALAAGQGQYVLWGTRSDLTVVPLAHFTSSASAVDLGTLDDSIVSVGEFTVTREALGTIAASPQGPAVLQQQAV